MREGVLVVMQQGRYTGQALTELCESSETGPLGFLAAAMLLNQFHSPATRQIAARGLERLSAEDFRRDCRVLLTGHSVLSQCLQNLASSLAGLNEDAVNALTASQPHARATFIRECARRLRESKGQPVFEALAPALDQYWNSEFRAEVAAALRSQSVDPVAAYEAGLSIYQSNGISPDYAEAARLFQQAAQAGHAGAQFYLALLYQRGKGVPKDLMTALNWYRQSAANGNVEAAMTLGSLYDDGFDVERDRVAAFAWYSVAAARGHKVAPTLRDGLRRQLSASQLAEGEKQAKDILEQKPDSKSP